MHAGLRDNDAVVEHFHFVEHLSLLLPMGTCTCPGDCSFFGVSGVLSHITSQYPCTVISTLIPLAVYPAVYCIKALTVYLGQPH